MNWHIAPMIAEQPVTALLAQWREGDARALDALTPIVYDELHQLAVSLFRGERQNHTLQPTAVVNEAYVRLTDAKIDWQGRSHFFALAARMMRRILIDHANARLAEKRGGGQIDVTLDENALAAGTLDLNLLDLERALNALAAEDERKAKIMEMRLFAGLSYEDLAEVTGLSVSTLEREIRFSRAWLAARLKDA